MHLGNGAKGIPPYWPVRLSRRKVKAVFSEAHSKLKVVAGDEFGPPSAQCELIALAEAAAEAARPAPAIAEGIVPALGPSDVQVGVS